MPRIKPLSLFLALVLVGVEAGATEPDDATKSSARRLGDEAGALFEKGDWAGALDKYQRAAALVDVPTLGVRIARCLDKLGRLVEANERYLAVTRMKLAPDALDVHKQAQLDAQTERAALLPRIPTLIVGVAGPANVAVAIDGKPISSALFGQRGAVNPGHHHVVARRGGEEQVREVDVREGASARVDFEFAPGPASEGPGAQSAAPANVAPGGRAPADADAGRNPGAKQRTLGWVSLGLGGAGLITGLGAGGIAMGKKSDLEKICGSSLDCPPSAHDDARSYNRMRTISTVGFVVGGVGLAAGVTLMLTAPRRDGAEVGAFVGPTSLGVAGRF